MNNYEKFLKWVEDMIVDISEIFHWNNKTYVLKSVKQDGMFLQYANKRLKDDKEIVLAAIKQNGEALKYASDRLKEDLSLVFEALNTNWKSFYAPHFPQKYNREVILHFLQLKLKDAPDNDSFSLKHYGFPKHNADREVVLASVKQNGEDLANIDETLTDDREVVLEAVRNKGVSIQWASDRLKNDIEVVMEAINQDASSFIYISKELKDDKEVVMEAVKRDGNALCFASTNLQDNEEFVLEAIKHSTIAYIGASKRILFNESFLLKVLEIKDIEEVKECLNNPMTEYRFTTELNVMPSIWIDTIVLNDTLKKELEIKVKTENTPPKRKINKI